MSKLPVQVAGNLAPDPDKLPDVLPEGVTPEQAVARNYFYDCWRSALAEAENSNGAVMVPGDMLSGHEPWYQCAFVRMTQSQMHGLAWEIMEKKYGYEMREQENEDRSK